MFCPLCSLRTETMEGAADGEGEQVGEEVAPIQDPEVSPRLAETPAPQQVHHQVLRLLVPPLLSIDYSHDFCLWHSLTSGMRMDWVTRSLTTATQVHTRPF